MPTIRASTDYVAVHCSATPPTLDIGAVWLDRVHRDRGFLSIGYHLVIRRNGALELGRGLAEVGAHVEDFNHNSVGVCLVGGVSADDPKKAENDFTPEQFASLETVLRFLRLVYPKATVQGHRDFPNVKKECPCFDVKPWVQQKGI